MVVLAFHTLWSLPQGFDSSPRFRSGVIHAPGDSQGHSPKSRASHCFIGKTRGELLVITRGREENDLEGKLPFPLTKSEMFRFKEFGLKLIQLEDYFDHEEPPLRRFRAHFKKEV